MIIFTVWKTKKTHQKQANSMKNLIITITLIFCFSGFTQLRASLLSIHSNPDSIDIRLDSVLIGKTPVEKLEVRPGRHIIEVISPDPGLWNSNNQIIRFSVSAGSDTTIIVKLMQPIKINSIPYHAELFQDFSSLGLTPVTIMFEQYRGKELRLEKNGFESKTFTLSEPKSYLFKLEPIKLAQANEESGSFLHSMFHTKMKSKFLLLTGTVVTNWLAFYLKNLADENYNKYRTTGNPQRMNAYWDKTQKYDRLSDISIGISYAFLGGLIFTVIW
jgi:hypothetical protein